MQRQYFVWRVFFALALHGSITHFTGDSHILAETPWQRMSLFKHVEADADKSYPLAEKHGPWMIMCCTFSGEGAERQAQELVYELRSKFGYLAYVHRMDFDYSKGTVGRGLNEYGEPLKMKFQKDRIGEVAVLVGDYPAVDDPVAKRSLEKLKYIKPACLDLAKLAKAQKKDNRSLGGWRVMQQYVQEVIADKDDTKHRKGPLGHAFITSNPLLPKEYFKPKGLDSLVVKMNEPVEHSLLNCPGRYTVQVATFTGCAVVDPKQIQKLEQGAELPSQLAEAAERAHKLTVALRLKNWEAYEFHDRAASIVTVGSFDQVGSPRPDGKTEINPQIHELMKTFGADKQVGPTGAQVGQPKNVAGIPLDIQPLIVEVPRRSISADYAESRFSAR